MSKYSLEIAKLYALTLKSFKSLEDAKKFFFDYKELKLREISEIINDPKLDFTINSLKHLESKYFDLIEKNDFDKIGLSKEEFERSMGIYYGETAIKNNLNSQWVVEEFPFEKGKYAIGVHNGAGGTYMLTNAFINHDKVPDNKRKQYLYRNFKKYFT